MSYFEYRDDCLNFNVTFDLFDYDDSSTKTLFHYKDYIWLVNIIYNFFKDQFLLWLIIFDKLSFLFVCKMSNHWSHFLHVV